MTYLLKGHGLSDLIASEQRCAECGRATVHYREPKGLPVCSGCGYNTDQITLHAGESADEAKAIVRTIVRGRHALPARLRPR